MEGFMNVLEASRKFRCKLFCPSTIGAFGTSTPKQKTPDFTIMRPSTIYGITKVHMELMGEVTIPCNFSTITSAMMWISDQQDFLELFLQIHFLAEEQLVLSILTHRLCH